MGQRQSVEDTIMDMRMKGKEMKRSGEKIMKEEKTEKLKVKAALERGDKESAELYAQTAIRKRNEALNNIRLATKMESVASRLETATRSQEISESMTKVVPQLSGVLKKMNPKNLGDSMAEFGKIFEDLDVYGDYVGDRVDSTIATTIPTEQVEELISKVTEEYALDVSSALNNVTTPLEQRATEVDDVSARIKELNRN